MFKSGKHYTSHTRTSACSDAGELVHDDSSGATGGDFAAYSSFGGIAQHHQRTTVGELTTAMDSKAASTGDLDRTPSPSLVDLKSDVKMPAVIAHRGYKACFPENTMAAFKGAIDVGAEALETDVHLSKDGVVVLSHDATLQRCFGRPGKTIDHDWSYLETLQTIRQPSQPMPSLKQLLDYLGQPGLEHVWLLLDVKRDNDLETIMTRIAATIASASAQNLRIYIGCYTTEYLPITRHDLPSHPLAHIGISTSYARKFSHVDNLVYNMAVPILQGPGGAKFIKTAHQQHHPVWAWTVNSKVNMEWCISQGLDGIITDDPKLLIDVCRGYDSSKSKRLPVRDLIYAYVICFMALIFGYRWRNRKTANPSTPAALLVPGRT